MRLFQLSLKLFAILLLCLSIFTFPAPPLKAQDKDLNRIHAQAEKYYSEGSYARAHELYLQARETKLTAEEKRWVDFRIEDTRWRAQAGTRTSDSSTYDQARQTLESMVRDIQRVEDRDRLWAEVHESLGDFWWMRTDSKNWSKAWGSYQKALDWWAGAPDIEPARKRYLDMVWKMTSPPWREPYYYYGYYGNNIPLNILEDVLKIAKSKDDQIRAHYLLAMTLRRHGGNLQNRVSEEFEAAIKGGKSFDWYDDALYHYAEWMSRAGEIIILKKGGQRRQGDFVKVVELFRRLINEFEKGETRYYDQAKRQLENITRPKVGLRISNIFLPDSEIQIHLNWRNVQGVNLTLYPVDLTRDIEFSSKESVHRWIHQINLRTKQKLKSWLEPTDDNGDFKPGKKTLHLDEKLPLGAYVLEASGGGEKTRELILVTDTSLVLKTSGKQALIYYADAQDGSPVSEASVAIWERSYHNKKRKWFWQTYKQKTNKDGLAVFDLKDSRHNSELFVSAKSGDRQAFSTGYSRHYSVQPDRWKMYVFTDRPAYRPGETAQWKVIARTYDGSLYSTPSNITVEYRITDPRGSKLTEGKLKLNEFGSAWGSFPLNESLPLGPYSVTFWDKGRKRTIGHATLFRLEEYKLPEFKVAIETPTENGKKKSFRLGDPVEISVQAEYYFGGPVSGAKVEIVVFQRPFKHYWRPPTEFSWYYRDIYPQPGRNWGGKGQRIKREVIKTNPEGKATFTLETSRNNQDLEYHIEARVTDASRREVVAVQKIKVARQSYYVHLQPEHKIYRPQDKLTVNINTMDANIQPVSAEGRVRVTRDYWFEIWLDPAGREVKGKELKTLKQESAIFPPPPSHPEDPGWRLKFRGYQHDEILTRTVKTDAEGSAEFAFTPEREGYYRVAWTGEDKENEPIKGETTVWVATGATTDLGYRHGGLEIIVDKETFRAGQTAPIMLSAPTNGSYVLFSVEGDDLYSYQLVHLTGTVKLIELPIEEKHVPNIFLNAVMVSDRQIFQDTKQVVVPPVKNFLKVKIESDRKTYRPQEEGTLTITTLDHEDRPVAAEVALGLVDESVYTIQSDLAPDPRQFFFGTKRNQQIRTTSTFHIKSYAQLVEGEKGNLIDTREIRFKKAHGTGRYNVDEIRREGERIGSQQAMLKERLSSSFADSATALRSKESLMNLAMEAPAPMAKKSMAADGKSTGSSIQVRSDFRSTVFWKPDVRTGKDGTVKVRVKFPDSLTQWRATGRVVSGENRFGVAKELVHTRKPLIVRLQAPRFFVVGDTVTVSAIINNNTSNAITVSPTLQTEGLVVSGVIRNGKTVKREPEPVTVPAKGQKRIDWKVSVQTPGSARIRVTAKGKNLADAMERTYTVHDHGLEKFVSKAGKMRGDDLTVRLHLPKERKPESTEMTIQVAPSMAVTMLDALPYLIDYPYGCTEQTMSRFLPAVITSKTLADLGLKPESVMEKIFGGIERGPTDKTHPKGRKNLTELDAMVQKGLQRLYDFQHGDGGWGWWKKGESDHFMTAYVLWGMTLAGEAGIEISPGVFQQASGYLDKELVEEETHFDMQAWMLHALSANHSSSRLRIIGKFQSKAFDNLWNNRSKLNAYTRSLLALTAHNYGETRKAKTLVENLENGVKIDQTPDTSLIQRGQQKSHESVQATAHWGEDGIFRRWSQGGVEATAFALSALLTIDPDNSLIEPVTNWLIKNRRGSNWSNTRDTTITLLALNKYLRISEELKTDMEYEVFVNGKSIGRTKVDDPLRAPNRFSVEQKLLRDGDNDIRILRTRGKGPVYFSIQARFFSLEEPIPPAGNEIFLRRQYYKLVGRPTLLKGYVYDKKPLEDGDTVNSGERIETILHIEAKNHYEYLVFEDFKPAGLEAVQIRSGETLYAKELKSAAVNRKFDAKRKTRDKKDARGSAPSTPSSKQRHIVPPDGHPAQDFTGRTQWVYQELRDRKMVLFIDKLPEGVWEVRYTLRAEVPGKFHALPVLGHAMYIPEIRANGREIRLTVTDKGQGSIQE